jgi:4-hydroxybenzoate decarboxylase subunit C
MKPLSWYASLHSAAETNPSNRPSLKRWPWRKSFNDCENQGFRGQDAGGNGWCQTDRVMKHLNLRSYLQTLQREGELKVVEESIDPHLDLAEIQRRVVARRGPALLFAKVSGTDFPVVANLFGTRRRIELAFGENPIRFVRRVVEAAHSLMPPKLSRLWEFRDLARDALSLGTRAVKTGPAIDTLIRPARLTMLPQIKSWPKDGGAFLTLPLVYSEHPGTGKGNLGMYRIQLYEDTIAGMHFQIHRGIGFHYHESEQRNVPLPVNLFLGGPPALIMAAIAPLPEDIPELILAALLQGERIRLIRDRKISPLPVVAEADFTLVGSVPPRKRRLEGPFGDHYGYYSMTHEYPVFEVDRIYHRRDAVFPATVVGRPPQEDHYIGEYLQDLLSPVFPLVMNGVADVRAYDEAGVHTLAAAVVKNRYWKEAFMAALRILGEGQLSLTKFLLVTDAPLSLKEFKPLLMHILERADFASDLYVFANVAQDTLDYTSRKLNEGSKAILLGLGEKRFALREAPAAELKNPQFRKMIVFAPGVLVVEGPAWKENDHCIHELLQEEAVQGFRMIIMADNANNCAKDEASFMWTVFTRFEPAADIFALQSAVQRYHVLLSAPILLDCRVKPWFPPEVKPLAETVAKIDSLWPRIFPDDKL